MRDGTTKMRYRYTIPSRSSEERECSKSIGKRIRKTWETILYSATRNEKQRRRFFFFFRVRVPFERTSLPLIACSCTREGIRVSGQVARKRRDLTRKTWSVIKNLLSLSEQRREITLLCVECFQDTSGGFGLWPRRDASATNLQRAYNHIAR